MDIVRCLSDYVRSLHTHLWNVVERGSLLSRVNLFGAAGVLLRVGLPRENAEHLPNAPTSAAGGGAPDVQEPDFAVLTNLRDFFKRFVLLPDDSLYLLIALWTLGTYLYEQFEYFGYLFIHSPEPQSGKSRLLEVLQQVTHNASEISVDPTPAVLFRTATNATHLMDEVDGWTNKDELKNVLNAGFRRGNAITRLREERGDYTAHKFKVYAPRALAGIGTSILDHSTRDRCFIIRMVRQKPNERCKPFRLNRLQKEIPDLQGEIKAWVAKHKAAVAGLYECEEFNYLDPFRDRTIDISQSLAAIMTVAFQGHANAEDAKATLLKAIEITRLEQQSPSEDHALLKQLAEMAKTEDPLIGNATELAEKLQPLVDKVDEHAISALLRKYDFKPKSKRRPGEQPRSRYILAQADLQDLCDRYAAEILDEKGTQEQQ